MLREHARLVASERRTANWKRWGPYLSERQWGTVREDYSATGDAWNYFPHDHARSRAYRWGEDGLLGITDRQCRLCLAVALWNGRDPILKERLFGLTNGQGNHGEDVKECYYYLDSSPTHAYLKALYKYPQAEFPYDELVRVNRERSRAEPEFELADTGIFDGNRYFDVLAEYAKAGPDDILLRLSVTNRGPEAARLHVLPTLWFRNTWSWGCEHEGCELKPRLAEIAPGQVGTWHATLGRFDWLAGPASDGTQPQLLYCENETNRQRLYGEANVGASAKDAFHAAVIQNDRSALAPERAGTKAAAWYDLWVPAGGTIELKLRLEGRPAEARDLSDEGPLPVAPRLGAAFDTIFAERIGDTDAFYDAHLPGHLSADERQIARQAYAGLLWSKQFYHYSVRDWLTGDPDQPPPPPARMRGRNTQWQHLFNRDIVSMPDKWEYPWYAAWDLAFHMIPFASVDPDFAKEQLILFLREWYMHPSGQIPAYEFEFSDVNPPVHAWAAWRVYKMAGPRGQRDVEFLKRVFHKLLINFTWWVNRKDVRASTSSAAGFWGSTTLESLTARSPCRPAASSSRRMAPPGWRFSARPCWRWRSNCRGLMRAMKTWRPSSSSTLCRSWMPCTRWAAAACGTRRTASTTTFSGPMAIRRRSRSARWSALFRSLPWKSSTRKRSATCPSSGSACSGFSITGRIWRGM